MRWTSLQTIFLGSLLLFRHRLLCAGSPKCITEEQFLRRTKMLQTGNGSLNSDLGNRSLSPWTYEMDINILRHPNVIYNAKCRYNGCFINGEESHAYNSVEVNTLVKVLYKNARDCPHNSSYQVSEGWIKVAVACTCVTPKI